VPASKICREFVEGFAGRKAKCPHDHPFGQWGGAPYDHPTPAIRAFLPCKPSAINLGDDRWRCGGRGYRALQRHTPRAVSPSPLARICRRRGAIPPQRAILSHPLGSGLHLIAGPCDMAAGEAETCLGKLTTLRSFHASSRAIERHQKLDQVEET
jgi:hypothetical protein